MPRTVASGQGLAWFRRQALRPGAVAAPDQGASANALLLNGRPIMLNGRYITLTKAA